MKTHHPFYILLIGWFPVLSFFNYNKEQLLTEKNTLIVLILVISIFSILSWILISIILKNRIQAALIVFLTSFIFFSYGHICNLFEYLHFKTKISFGMSTSKIVFFISICSFLLGLYFILKISRNNKLSKKFTKILNIITFSLVAFQLINIIYYESTKLNYKNSQEITHMASQVDTNYPDIYYIILDAYARDDILDEVFNYTEDELPNFLTNTGFFVAEKSKSNYAHTFLSLSSTLNMEYVNYFTDEIGKKSNDISIPLQMIENNEVVAFLKSRGYKFINFSSGWGPTSKNRNADINVRVDQLIKLGEYSLPTNEFYVVFLKTTMLSPFVENYIADNARERVIYNFEKIKEIPKIKEPTLVIAHFLAPHPPFLFDEKGNLPSRTKLEMIGEVYEDKENYLNQLKFISDKTQETIAKLISISDTRPIIILQSDHGPCTILGHPYKWERPPEKKISGIRERMSILNAYYLPDDENGYFYDELYEEISPVNTFRLIFNTYFETDFEILEDKSYYSDYINYYEFFDVTDKIKEEKI